MENQPIREAVMAGKQTGRPSTTYEKGRRCRVLRCNTPLSIYNPAEFCGAHATPDKRKGLMTYG